MKRALLLLALCACEREERNFHASTSVPQMMEPSTKFIAGEPPLGGEALDPAMPEYKETAYDVSEGRTLYAMFNCVGCHANGGGAIGPALIDKKWIYGSAPYEVASSILSGRPHGMPSYRGKLVRTQLYQLVAFVRSLGGMVRGDAPGARNDDMQLPPINNLDEKGLPPLPKERP
jgi:cytochrome c oxidase cbb3-type subunit III